MGAENGGFTHLMAIPNREDHQPGDLGVRGVPKKPAPHAARRLWAESLWTQHQREVQLPGRCGLLGNADEQLKSHSSWVPLGM
jgi:hypothetical protein